MHAEKHTLGWILFSLFPFGLQIPLCRNTCAGLAKKGFSNPRQAEQIYRMFSALEKEWENMLSDKKGSLSPGLAAALWAQLGFTATDVMQTVYKNNNLPFNKSAEQ